MPQPGQHVVHLPHHEVHKHKDPNQFIGMGMAATVASHPPKVLPPHHDPNAFVGGGAGGIALARVIDHTGASHHSHHIQWPKFSFRSKDPFHELADAEHVIKDLQANIKNSKIWAHEMINEKSWSAHLAHQLHQDQHNCNYLHEVIVKGLHHCQQVCQTQGDSEELRIMYQQLMSSSTESTQLTQLYSSAWHVAHKCAHEPQNAQYVNDAKTAGQQIHKIEQMLQVLAEKVKAAHKHGYSVKR
eukprot:CAMPEP_0184308252 /NCGR_PEP_ID=MMETSP1049-20130417/16752_1 /TAXON_ID=77928 /ORGANISM="Proteomonas sulcata, Strain CCMP704" /LENGTH=242 /DNA_ID=CAMNT_0026620899 /DNA_START=138 /DNA_END=866 /DNA_ORIENTATION=-